MTDKKPAPVITHIWVGGILPPGSNSATIIPGTEASPTTNLPYTGVEEIAGQSPLGQANQPGGAYSTQSNGPNNPEDGI